MIDFDMAYSDFHAELLSQTAARCGDLQVAQDVCYETWARAWKRRTTFDPVRGSVRAWLGSICRTALADYYLANGRRWVSTARHQPTPANPNEQSGDEYRQENQQSSLHSTTPL